MHDSLYRNSIYMISNTVITSLIGFVFWVVVARLYQSYEVGIATTMISASTLIAGFSLFGLNTALLRYMYKYKSNDQALRINTSLLFVALVSFMLALVYLLCINVFSPALGFIKENYLLAALFVVTPVAMAIGNIFDSVFIAYQRAEAVFIKNSSMSIFKLVIVVFFVSLGASGIYTAHSVSVLFAIALAAFMLKRKLRHNFKLEFNPKIIHEMSKFSLGNYMANFIEGISVSILPILITNQLGEVYSGYFYIDMMIAGAIYTIPISVSQVALAHGSKDITNVKNSLKKALKIIMLILLPAVLFISFFGPLILSIFGQEYADGGYTALVLLILASIPITFKLLLNAVFNIQHRIRTIIILNTLTVVVVIGLSLALMPRGLNGVALAWLIGETVGALVAVIFALSTSTFTHRIQEST